MGKAYPISNYQPYRNSKNPYYAKGIELQNLRSENPAFLVDANTENFRGKWRTIYKRAPNAFLQLELGTYLGETTMHLARTNPEHLCLGVEWKYKEAFRGAKKGFDQKLENFCIMRGNNARLPWVFAPGEVDRVWVLFPDPWSKKSQQKWRLLQPSFFKILASLLSEGKELMIKTNHAEYASFISESIREADCFDFMSESQADQIWSSIPPTFFERIFIRQQIPINRFSLVRNRKQVIPPEEVQEILNFS